MTIDVGTLWPLRRVKDLASKIGSGKTPASGSEPYHSSGILFLRSQNVHFDGLRLDDAVYIDASTHRSMRASEVHPGDVLLNITGASLGRVTHFPSSLGPANVNQHVCIVRPRHDVNARFLAYALAALNVQEAIFAMQVGGNRDGLNFEQVGGLPVLQPPQEEQRRIADFLDAETARVDRLIAAQRRVLALLAERRSTRILNAVTAANLAERRPTRLRWVASLPESWGEVKVSLVARMGSGHTPSRSHPDWWVDCTIPWITTGEVAQVREDRREEITETREQISKVGLENSAAELCPKGTVVLCRTASAGYSAIMGTNMATSQDFVTWQCGPRIDPFYLLWCLRAMRVDLLGRLAMGSTHKTIYVPDLQSLRIPLPPIEEQRTIVDGIRKSNGVIDRLADKIHRQLELLAERRQTLITAAVTGMISV